VHAGMLSQGGDQIVAGAPNLTPTFSGVGLPSTLEEEPSVSDPQGEMETVSPQQKMGVGVGLRAAGSVRRNRRGSMIDALPSMASNLLEGDSPVAGLLQARSRRKSITVNVDCAETGGTLKESSDGIDRPDLIMNLNRFIEALVRSCSAYPCHPSVCGLATLHRRVHSKARRMKYERRWKRGEACSVQMVVRKLTS